MTTADTPTSTPTATSTNPEDVVQPQDLAEIQGIILRGYKLEYARHFVLQILDPAAFKQFLTKIIPGGAAAGALTITTAAQRTGPRPDYFLNISFSWPGLQALNLPGVTFGTQFQFQAFKAGAVARAPQVGDVGASAPTNWLSCLNPANAPNAHAILTLYAASPALLEAHTTTLRGLFTAGGAAQAMTFDDGDTPGPDHFDAEALPNGFVHFGYKDGISQPQVAGMPPRRPDQQPDLPAWGAVLRKSSGANYPLPDPAIFSRNGGIAAFRILEQDVVGFDQYVSNQQGIDPELLKAKFCGRWSNGNPLALCPVSPGAPLPAAQLSNFSYDNDDLGDKTPVGAHTRRGNPRGSESAPPYPYHRIIRHAMPYGPPYEHGSNDDSAKRGLVGYFIGSSLEQMFEFIMRVWLNGQQFAVNFTEPLGVDPLLGDEDDKKTVFDFPPSGHVSGFERFVTTRGGMYCFLPSIPALTWMSQQT